jgi:hypothetical protein
MHTVKAMRVPNNDTQNCYFFVCLAGKIVGRIRKLRFVSFSNSLFTTIQSFDAMQSEMLTASLYKLQMKANKKLKGDKGSYY